MKGNKGQFENLRERIPCREISGNAVFSKKPLVSVHMVTYNHGPYIAQSIEGVLQQETDFPFELIIGEDCSSDNTREIVLEYQKIFPEIIRVVISDYNAGAHENYKRVYARCRGKYIAYCEGDDHWHHTLKLKKQVEYLELNPTVGLIHSDVDWHDEKKNKTIPGYYKNHSTSSSKKFGRSLVQDIITSDYVVTTCSVVVRASILKEILIECGHEFSNKYLMGDTQTWIELANRTKFHYINESLATYNVLSESACHSINFEKVYLFNKSAFEMRLYYAEKYGNSEIEIIKTRIIKNRIKKNLLLAYRNQLPFLADEARQLARSYGIIFSFYDLIFFYGSKVRMLNVIIRLAIFVVKPFMKFINQLRIDITTAD